MNISVDTVTSGIPLSLSNYLMDNGYQSNTQMIQCINIKIMQSAPCTGNPSPPANPHVLNGVKR